jgi:hypothetical protein
MTAEPTHVLFVVPSAQAIRGEAALRAGGIPCALIPVPRSLTSQCGVCLRVALEERVPAGEALAVLGIEVSAMYDFTIVDRDEGGGR